MEIYWNVLKYSGVRSLVDSFSYVSSRTHTNAYSHIAPCGSFSSVCLKCQSHTLPMTMLRTVVFYILCFLSYLFSIFCLRVCVVWFIWICIVFLLFFVVHLSDFNVHVRGLFHSIRFSRWRLFWGSHAEHLYLPNHVSKSFVTLYLFCTENRSLMHPGVLSFVSFILLFSCRDIHHFNRCSTRCSGFMRHFQAA